MWHYTLLRCEDKVSSQSANPSYVCVQRNASERATVAQNRAAAVLVGVNMRITEDFPRGSLKPHLVRSLVLYICGLIPM